MPTMVATKYEDDNGRIHPIRLRPQVFATVQGTVPTGAVNDRTHVKVSRGGREFGLRPRALRIAITRGTAPLTFVDYATIPLLNAGDLGDPSNAVGSIVTYKGENWRVAAHIPENAR